MNHPYSASHQLTLKLIAAAACLLFALPAQAEDKMPPPAAAASKIGTKTFVNSKEGHQGNLLQHYVDFSFQYPAAWKILSHGKSPGNFVRAERELVEGNPPLTYTQEQLAVGTFFIVGPAELAPLFIPDLLRQQSARFSQQFADYKLISSGEAKLGEYKTHELRFSAALEDKVKGTIKIWGRCILMPDPKDAGDGVMIIMLATSLADGITGIDDVGVKGELPVILKSFKFGRQP